MYAVRRRWPTSQPCAAVTLRNTHTLTNDDNEDDAGDDDNGNSDGNVGGDKLQKLEING